MGPEVSLEAGCCVDEAFRLSEVRSTVQSSFHLVLHNFRIICRWNTMP